MVAWVPGEVEAIVDVGAADEVDVLGAVAVVDGVEPLELVPDDEGPPVSGEGETIATVDAEVEGDAVAEVAEDPVALDDEDCFWDTGLELSFGTPLANGSRAIRARTTLTGSAEGVGAVVVVLALVAVAAGGAGTVGVVLADAPLSRSTGTATTATRSVATTIHSLRSTRSRRSELILILRSSSCRPRWPAGRWWR
jgi:hypothetical protein